MSTPELSQDPQQNLSNWLSGLPGAKVPMPSPADARKLSTKQTPEKKIEFGQKLAKRRSQDFASKIQGWNDTGAGVLPKQELTDGLEKQKGTKETKKGKEKEKEKKEKEEKPRKETTNERKEQEPEKNENVVEVIYDVESADASDDRSEKLDAAEIIPSTTPKPSVPTPDVVVNPNSSAKKAGRDIDVRRGAWVRRKSKPQVELATDVRHAGAPKKRIVSDGHWRRDRLPKEDVENAIAEKENEPTPRPVVIKRSVVSVGLKIPPASINFNDPSTEPVKIRSLRQFHSRSHSPSDSAREGSPDYETTGTRLYIKSRRQSRQRDDHHLGGRDPRASDGSLTAPSSGDRPSSATDYSASNPAAIRKIPSTPLSEPRRNIRKSLSGEGALHSRSAGLNSDREDETRRRPSIRKRSKTSDEPSTRPAISSLAPPPVNIYGNRIQGWLANTLDPFDDGSDRSLAPEPLNLAKIKAKRSVGSGRERRALDETTESSAQNSADGWSDTSPSTTPTLQRRGARRNSRSPIKARSSRDSSMTTDEPVMSGALPGHPKVDRVSSSDRPQDRTRARTSRPLSAISSVNTFQPRSQQHRLRSPSVDSETHTIVPEGSVLSRASDGDPPRRHGSGLKRRLTKHSDLMSVLSMSREDSRPMTSGRSLRRRRTNAEPTSIGELMNDLSVDELKYQRELRTLVDGVIPVLLQGVLSGSESSGASRRFSRPTTDPSVTKPIVDMGISLERLKTCHKRIPLHEPSDLLIWAESASKLYADYLKTWRLGFKDIMVNLLPVQDLESKEAPSGRDHGLPRGKDAKSDDSDAQQVDVAYLLKRPLVRLKYLVKTFKGICQLQPSAKADATATMYQDLVQEAKRRVNDENARLEDEAAAGIDPTRARDPRSLAPITGVTIDSARCVHARDVFDMELTHSTGQQLGCKIEIIYRNDAPGRGSAGDLLFCEVSTSGRWLLFPPMPHSLVSARKGEQPDELVVMIRGYLSNARQWREIMLLRADDAQPCLEWLQMLGSSPLPPRLSKRSSFNMLSAFNSPRNSAPALSPQTQGSTDKSREPSPREIEVPIGERAKSSSRIWDGSEVNSVTTGSTWTEADRVRAARHGTSPSLYSSDDPYKYSQSDNESQPRYFYDEPAHDRNGGRRPKTAHARSNTEWTGSSVSQSTSDYHVWLPPSDKMSDESSTEEDVKPPKRPSMRRRTSSVPSLDLPNIPKLRKPGQIDLESQLSYESSQQPSHSSPRQNRELDTRDVREPASAAADLKKQPSTKFSRRSESSKENSSQSVSNARPTSLGSRTGALPSFTPAFLKKHRRSSSPLKHEYEPSTASDSLSDSDISAIDNAAYITSESSADEAEAEDVSTVGDLKAFQKYASRPYGQPQQTPAKQAKPKQAPPATSFSLPSASLAPSESASQAPYRTVPPSDVEPGKTVASIFCWSDRGTWESLHPEECSIYVTPGLIEAFDITQANSVPFDQVGDEARTPTAKGIKPLVALELTPLVPLRRGTALDISVRSPPAPNSLIRTGNNVMFRARSPEDCEKLYALINRARIDNPTYIALQNARGPVQQSNWGEVMEQRNAERTAPSTSWWRLGSRKSTTYRSKGSRTLSIAATESSIGTMNSAFSALRMFSGGNRIFNIAKSTVTSREGTRSTNSESLSSGVATPLPIDPRLGTPLGVTNVKIRLYMRESGSRWRDMGPARLTVMLPPRQDPFMAANPHTVGLVKRILIYGKTEGETLLDATLGESCFERVARTGIAVSVWEESIGPNGEIGTVGAVGGVLNARSKVYMVQMKSEREAAYTFGLVGKLRY